MTAALVISNASPIIALDQIEHLHLLNKLFPQLAIPEAVLEEVSPSVQPPSWIKVLSLAQPVGPRILETSLGRGESETLSLALELGAQRVILDERAARRLAHSLSIPVIGTLGILTAALREDLIPALRPLLDALLDHDFRIAERLYESVLRDAGEL